MHIPTYLCILCTYIHSTGTCILVRGKIRERSVHTSVREAGVTDVCTGHQTGSNVKINCVRTRQEISKHISIAYNTYFVLSYVHIAV